MPDDPAITETPAVEPSLIATAEGADTLAGAATLAGADTLAGAPATTPWDALTELAPPEGFNIPDDRKEELLGLVNGAQSRQELAAGLMALHAKELQTIRDAQQTEWNAAQETWKTELKADPDFSGEALGPTLAKCKQVAVQLGGKGFMEFLDLTGGGNNIHVAKMLLAAHKLLPAEGTPTGGNPTVAPKSLAQRIFPN